MAGTRYELTVIEDHLADLLREATALRNKIGGLSYDERVRLTNEEFLPLLIEVSEVKRRFDEICMREGL